jgi:flavin-dependent dehydrogenase
LNREGYAVDRGVFDQWLVGLAARKGARVWTETAVENMDGAREQGIWGARVRANDGHEKIELRARHWVNATGRRPAVTIPGKISRPFFACKTVFKGVRGLAGSVALHFIERGHVGLNPISPNEATLCLCVDGRYIKEAHGNLDQMIREFMSANPNLKHQLRDASRVSDWQTCQAEPDGRTIFYQDQKFFIGDALSMVNPVIGGGIPIAMQSGVMLANVLVDASRTGQSEAEAAAAFERAWKKTFAQKFGFGKAIGRAERSPVVSRLALGALSAAPGLLSGLFKMSRPTP